MSYLILTELKAIEVVLKIHVENMEAQLLEKKRYNSIEREIKQKAINYLAELIDKIEFMKKELE